MDAIPFRNAIRDRYEQIFNYEKVGAPRKIGDRYYISKNDGLQNQSVWYVRDGLDGEDRIFLDPNTLSEDGTVTASLSSASDDDKYVVVRGSATTPNGLTFTSEWAAVGSDADRPFLEGGVAVVVTLRRCCPELGQRAPHVVGA